MRSIKGYQGYVSGGINVKGKFFAIDFNPEFYFGGAGECLDFLNSWPSSQVNDFYFDFNYGDFPQYFGSGKTFFPWWGQSKITVQFGGFEAGISTKNTWWGPGQWNTLTFSNNAQGFPHISFNTIKPAKTFAGNLEMQFLMGKLESSNLRPTGIDELDDQFFDPLSDDWRYVNGLGLTWYPKWVNGLSLGFSRTVQQYSSTLTDRFIDLFPVFQGFQKKNFFENGNSVDFDSNGQDQQFTIFGSYRNIPSKLELYFEFGRRDHAFNWRDFVLSPEHARAYIFGFLKLVELNQINRTIQIRSEISHQQESVNRYIRYSGLTGLSSWHMHHQARGFTNFGQPLGVGIGPGGNIQTVEVALTKDFDKTGFLIERRENRQGFFYRSLGQQNAKKPWVDLSLGFLYDKQFGNLLLSSKLQFIHARNYQWQLDPSSTPEFPKGENLTSVMAQVSAIYFWKKREGK
ncbi:capsule assembly Wzi family protein [Algoriphagus sp.]|uniref:capsule assembly Wzi family protein n=1 Tax=Algoriphagus sp. TaxID=1872435 RepID=UPI00391B8790